MYNLILVKGRLFPLILWLYSYVFIIISLWEKEQKWEKRQNGAQETIIFISL